MVKEIYIRNENDPKYDDTLIDTVDPIEGIIAKIRVILGTSKGQVLGDYDIGVDLERLVFKTIQTQTDIEDVILKQINKYISTYPNYKVVPKVSFGHHTDGYDYAIVDIYINDVRTVGILVE